MIVHLCSDMVAGAPYWLAGVSTSDTIILMQSNLEAIPRFFQQHNCLILNQLPEAKSATEQPNDYIDMVEFVTLCAQADQVISW